MQLDACVQKHGILIGARSRTLDAWSAGVRRNLARNANVLVAVRVSWSRARKRPPDSARKGMCALDVIA